MCSATDPVAATPRCGQRNTPHYHRGVHWGGQVRDTHTKREREREREREKEEKQKRNRNRKRRRGENAHTHTHVRTGVFGDVLFRLYSKYSASLD